MERYCTIKMYHTFHKNPQTFIFPIAQNSGLRTEYFSICFFCLFFFFFLLFTMWTNWDIYRQKPPIFNFLFISKTLRNLSVAEKTRYFLISFSSVFHEALQNLPKSINTKKHKYKLINLNI